MRKKLFTLTLLLGLLQCAWADNVTYIKRTWDDNAKTVKSESLTANATKLTSSTTSLSDGWYYVEGEVNMGTLNIEGTDVHLILADGCQLNCKNIKLEVPHVLGNLSADSTARPTSPAFTSGTGRRYTRSDCENLSWQVLTDRTRKPQGRNALGLLFQRTSRRRRETRRLLLQSGVIRICFPGRQRK